MSPYAPAADRYDRPAADWFRRCGSSGLLLPAVSLGCWHNFGGAGTDAARSGDEASHHENARRMLFAAFDHGITHFDLANNYGPPPGAAEERVGRILADDFAAHRDELILSSKAGYRMWPGPYGDGSSRKYLLASLDASLRRLRVEYVDIFYSHRYHAETPIEETMDALDTAVRQGKALYAGISSYPGQQTVDAVAACRRNGWAVPIIHQPAYSMLNRRPETDVLPFTGTLGMGVIAFSPLAQGVLTDKYLREVPADSRALQAGSALSADRLTPALLDKVRQLNDVAVGGGRSLAQLAVRWVLREQAHGRVTSALIGASRPAQVIEMAKVLDGPALTGEELTRIEQVLTRPSSS
jgi:L-glyceraldehyde 3-phosphate reductase